MGTKNDFWEALYHFSLFFPLILLSGGFSTVSDGLDHRGGKREVSICGRNIDSDPTGEIGIEFSLPPQKGMGFRSNCQLKL
jgi:hypothetical protein